MSIVLVGPRLHGELQVAKIGFILQISLVCYFSTTGVTLLQVYHRKWHFSAS